VTERLALFAPVYDGRPTSRSFLRQLPDRPPTAIASGSLTLLPNAPVLLEHNPDRQVGRIRSLFRMEWPDGPTTRMWHAALLELDSDDWPRNQPVSIGFNPLFECMLLDGRCIVESAIVSELSITSTPAIPGATLLPPTADRATPGRRVTVPGQAPRKTLIRNFGEILEIR
jgi:hypothetical protein